VVPTALKNISGRGSAAAIRRADDDICPRFELQAWLGRADNQSCLFDL